MQKRLIIWDFDGVIDNTEKLWLKNRMETINKYFAKNWDYETTYKYLAGMSDKTKKDVLNKMGIITNDKFWLENYDLDSQTIKKGFELTPGIEEIFKDKKYKQCIATGGTQEKTARKIDVVGIRKYFPEDHVFTADMVCEGKPEPDLFLLAAEKMNEKAENCLVIEDSANGIKAAIKAGMIVWAFAAYENNPQVIDNIKKLGVQNIFFDMDSLKKRL